MSFNDIPIRRKLTLVILVTSSAMLLLAGAALIIYEFFAYKKNLVEHIQTVAQIAAEHSSAPLGFSDKKAAYETLSSLKLEVREACLYDKEGRIFSRYPPNSRVFPGRPPPKGSYVEGENIVVVLPVLEKGVVLGSIYIRADFAPVYERIGFYAVVVVLVLLGSFIVTVAISSIFQKRISEPILALADISHTISEKKDYSVRAPKLTADELGTLTDAFNDMLSQIQQRDLEIRRLNSDLERRVDARTAELSATNKELEAFTYSVAHDLRAPLRHIDGYVQILLQEFASQLPANGQMYATRIQEGARNMGRLVDDLLNLARVGRQEVNFQVTSLQPIVNDVLGEFRAEAATRNIDWRVGELPFVECDPGLMKQVFANLISNAIKYTRPRTQPIIEIGQAHVNGQQAIFVRDNGVGFSMKYANKLFGVFQRLHRAEDFEGTGVGLATVDRIIRKHGGKVWAEAELDKGATFYFVLDKSLRG